MIVIRRWYGERTIHDEARVRVWHQIEDRVPEA
jgi:hypothetical protein